MTATMTKAGVRAPRRYTKAPMTLAQRLILEALRDLGVATTYAIAEASGISRDNAKSIVSRLMSQGYIERTKRFEPVGKGRLPAEYAWTGKPFPASAEVVRPTEPVRPDIALLVNAMNAMVHVGRAQA